MDEFDLQASSNDQTFIVRLSQVDHRDTCQNALKYCFPTYAVRIDTVTSINICMGL